MLKPNPGPFSREQLVPCIERELGQRHRVYGGLIYKGKMKQGMAEFEIGMMERIHSIMLVLRDDDEIAKLVHARLGEEPGANG